MVVKAASGRIRRKVTPPTTSWKVLFVRYLPAWLALAVVLVIVAPRALTFTLETTGRVLSVIPAWMSTWFAQSNAIAPLFTPQVRHWANDIERWAQNYDLDPNLLATVMQIESCGHPTVSSYAGAQGLFQVMPFHFSLDENQLDPETNARRAADFLNLCLTSANGDSSLALACYNGGPSVLGKSYTAWHDQTQRYYYWGTGIYADALNRQPRSERLDQWLAAGGSNLCQQAEVALNLS
jgi:hypothetical protein